jgi:hypothetical protein
MSLPVATRSDGVSVKARTTALWRRRWRPFAQTAHKNDVLSAAGHDLCEEAELCTAAAAVGLARLHTHTRSDGRHMLTRAHQ